MSGSRTERVGLRVLGGIGLVVATVIHVMVGFPPAGALAVLFLLSALGTLLGAVLLALRPRLGWIVGGGVSALTAIGYLLRSTVGLPPLLPNAVPFTQPPSGAVSCVVEIVVALLAVWALSGRSAPVAGRARSEPAGAEPEVP